MIFEIRKQVFCECGTMILLMLCRTLYTLIRRISFTFYRCFCFTFSLGTRDVNFYFLSFLYFYFSIYIIYSYNTRRVLFATRISVAVWILNRINMSYTHTCAFRKLFFIFFDVKSFSFFARHCSTLGAYWLLLTFASLPFRWLTNLLCWVNVFLSHRTAFYLYLGNFFLRSDCVFTQE